MAFSETFVSKSEIEQLLAFLAVHERDMQPSVSGGDVETSYRKSLTLPISCETLRNRAAALVNIPPDHCECIQLIKYEKGGFFKLHHDAFYKDSAWEKKNIRTGGQRNFSIVAYLDVSEKEKRNAGGTSFPNMNITIQPRMGTAIAWSNLVKKGRIMVPDERLLHEGLPTAVGRKVILNIFFRTKSQTHVNNGHFTAFEFNTTSCRTE